MKPLCTDLLRVKSAHGAGDAGIIRCKRWSCEVCREINRRHVIELAKAGRPTAMLTLTVSSNHYADPAEAAADLKRGLVALRKRIARRWPGERMPFLAVFEQHKSGFPHLHLLIRARFMPIRWLRDVWTEITGSWNVNITSLKGHVQRAAYCAKYIGKDLHAFAHCKRWWRSHDYHIETAEQEEDRWLRIGWSRWHASLPHLISGLRALGCEVEKDGPETVRWRSPPDRPVAVGEAFSLAAAWWPQRAARRAPGPRSC